MRPHLVKVGGDHGADAVARVELQQQGALRGGVHQVRALHAPLARRAGRHQRERQLERLESQTEAEEKLLGI